MVALASSREAAAMARTLSTFVLASARTEVEDAGVKEISFEISSSLVPCTILLNPAAAHRRGCATMRYTRTFAARLSVVYPMTPLLASPYET